MYTKQKTSQPENPKNNLKVYVTFKINHN